MRQVNNSLKDVLLMQHTKSNLCSMYAYGCDQLWDFWLNSATGTPVQEGVSCLQIWYNQGYQPVLARRISYR